jgi:hypothetical protein
VNSERLPSQGEYDDFYADVFKHYQPVGWLEKNLVDKIAAWSWRRAA